MVGETEGGLIMEKRIKRLIEIYEEVQERLQEHSDELGTNYLGGIYSGKASTYESVIKDLNELLEGERND